MSDMQKFMKIVRTFNERQRRPSATKAEELKNRAYNSTETDSEWLQLEQDIQEYMSTNPSEAEKKILFSFGEMVGMRCSAIRLKQKG